MKASIDLVCMMCTEEFLVPGRSYTDVTRVLQCPCCGSTDLAPLAYEDDDLPLGGTAA